MTEMDDYKAILQMIGDINERITELQHSYKTLNDYHHNLEVDFTEMRTELRTERQTNKAWIKYVFGTSLLGFIISITTLATLLRQLGVI